MDVTPTRSERHRPLGSRVPAFDSRQPDRRAPFRAGSRRADPTSAATALLALVDGLALQSLGGHVTPDTAVAAFDACAPALVAHPA